MMLLFGSCGFSGKGGNAFTPTMKSFGSGIKNHWVEPFQCLFMEMKVGAPNGRL